MTLPDDILDLIDSFCDIDTRMALAKARGRPFVPRKLGPSTVIPFLISKQTKYLWIDAINSKYIIVILFKDDGNEIQMWHYVPFERRVQSMDLGTGMCYWYENGAWTEKRHPDLK